MQRGLPREDNQDTVDHIDNNPSNNRLENLRWASRVEQMKHSYATNKERKTGGAKTSKPVKGRRLGTTEWIEYANMSDAARANALNSGNVYRCCAKKIPHVDDFEFEYSSPNEVDTMDGEEWRDVVLD